MKTSKRGLDLIKSFEGCRLTAYKAVPTEKYYTIGWGHYGPDVKKGQKITQAQADVYLVNDLAKYEAKVNKYMPRYNFNQNQYDALVSFAYNVGSIDGLTAHGIRSISTIASKFMSYTKSGGKVLGGLIRRREAEKNLFTSPISQYVYDGVDLSKVFDPAIYASVNPDVKEATNGDPQLMFNHFVTFGMREGRVGSKQFNVWTYQDNNPDLVSAFGRVYKNSIPSNVLIEYYKHYCVYGCNENRRSV